MVHNGWTFVKLGYVNGEWWLEIVSRWRLMSWLTVGKLNNDPGSLSNRFHHFQLCFPAMLFINQLSQQLIISNGCWISPAMLDVPRPAAAAWVACHAVAWGCPEKPWADHGANMESPKHQTSRNAWPSTQSRSCSFHQGRSDTKYPGCL